jgi:hypothetical protein
VVCAAVIPFALLSGCSNMVSTAPADNSLDSAAGISGIVHGGRQPIIGATVKLWAAGNAGYGSTTTSLQSTTTDSNGNFSFHTGSGATYSCPSVSSSTESQYIYITSSGGQPTTGVTNSAAALMLALGNCSTVLAANPSVVVNEVTTVASMFALQQFFSPSGSGLGSFGTSATNINGLANAFATVNNLVNINSGTAIVSLNPQTSTITGYTTAPTVTITPEPGKINTLANILAACVNSSGSGAPCTTTLFSGVNSTAALDTLQAAYYLATNPTSTVSSTSNLTAIYNTGVANSPFQPSLTAVPSDWTIGVSYASTSAQTSTTNGTVDLLSYPSYPAVDASGDVWWINANTGSGAGLAGNSITEMSPTGVPIAQALSSTTVTTAATSVVGGHGLVIDPSANVWVANFGSSSTSASNTGGYQNNVLKYNPTSTTVTSYTVGYGPTTLASDGAGNIFVADTNVTFTNASAAETTGSGVITKISSGGTVTTPVSGVALTQYGGLALDSNYNLWLASGGTTTAEYLANVGTAYTSSNSVTSSDPEPLVIDSSNNAWIVNYGTTTPLDEVGAANAVATLAIGGAYTGGGLAKAELAAIDGAGNIWVTNYTKNAGYVTEFSHAGIAISPATTGFAKSTSYWYGTYGIAVDASGNVWVGNFSSPTFYTEIVGQAAPVVTPLAAGLPTTAGGTSKLGTRP